MSVYMRLSLTPIVLFPVGKAVKSEFGQGGRLFTYIKNLFRM